MGEKMNLFISKEAFNYLTSLARTNINETAGDLVFKKCGNDYFLTEIKNVNNKEMIEKAQRKSIDFNLENFITNLIYEVCLREDSKGIVVRFHTHPSLIGLASPSNADIEFMKARQKSVQTVNEQLKKDYLYVEAIITEKEIGFYYSKDGKIKRAHAFVDGEEMIPRMPNNKSAKKSFLDGFKKGLQKNK